MAQFAFGSGRYSHGEAVSSEIEDKDSYMLRKPKGVIAIVTLNFPLAIGMFWNAAPALVKEHTVIKPRKMPQCQLKPLFKFKEAGIPRGVINLCMAMVLLVTLWFVGSTIFVSLVVPMSDNIFVKWLLSLGTKLPLRIRQVWLYCI